MGCMLPVRIEILWRNGIADIVLAHMTLRMLGVDLCANNGGLGTKSRDTSLLPGQASMMDRRGSHNLCCLALLVISLPLPSMIGIVHLPVHRRDLGKMILPASQYSRVLCLDIFVLDEGTPVPKSLS